MMPRRRTAILQEADADRKKIWRNRRSLSSCPLQKKKKMATLHARPHGDGSTLSETACPERGLTADG